MSSEPVTSAIPVVILCGGMGTRLAEETDMRPKPLVEIGGHPILWHIMKHYSKYGFNEFILALGYKGEHIKRYFLDFYNLGRDLTLSLEDGQVHTLGRYHKEPWRIHLIDTGLTTLTGGRLKQVRHLINHPRFLMTYGDGVADIDLAALLKFHTENAAKVTLTAVRPPARFGALDLDNNRVRDFKEKPRMDQGWINGGFFVIDVDALNYVGDGEDTMWEHAPLEHLADDGKLFAYRHPGFWQCMDTVRDLRYLQGLWDGGTPPWKIW